MAGVVQTARLADLSACGVRKLGASLWNRCVCSGNRVCVPHRVVMPMKCRIGATSGHLTEDEMQAAAQTRRCKPCCHPVAQEQSGASMTLLTLGFKPSPHGQDG
jgi:hypothetical protein